MVINKKEEHVICVFDEEGITLEQKILEAFDYYLNANLQNSKDMWFCRFVFIKKIIYHLPCKEDFLW